MGNRVRGSDYVGSKDPTRQIASVDHPDTDPLLDIQTNLTKGHLQDQPVLMNLWAIYWFLQPTLGPCRGQCHWRRQRHGGRRAYMRLGVEDRAMLKSVHQVQGVHSCESAGWHVLEQD